MALCLAVPGAAHAQCVPNPPTANGTVTCSGADTGGLTVNTNNTTVNVQQGATVSSVTATTLADPTQLYSSAGNTVTINDSGQITGGLAVRSGTPAPNAYYAPGTTVILKVASTGSIAGTMPISLISDGTGLYGGGNASISIDNSGTIVATAGSAISTNNTALTGILNLTNQASGVIGPVRATIVSLNNQGKIDGGSGSAIAVSLSGLNSVAFTPGQWSNSGSIVSSGLSSTLNLQSGYYSEPLITNSGTIANGAAGTAIFYSLDSNALNATLTNAAGGTVSSLNGTAIKSTAQLTLANSGTISGAGTAIAVTGGLTLTNSGTINGSVTAADGTSGYIANSMIDLRGGGTINGNLTLGQGNDTVIVPYVAGASGISGVTGSVDAGTGNNRLVYAVSGDATISSALNAAATFGTIGLDIAPASTVTLDTGFSISATLALTSSSSATLVNKANFTVSGPALTEGIYTGLIALDNRGSITANLANSSDTAIVLNQASIKNSGTITANGGNGVSQSAGFGQFTNSGKISASGTAVNIFDGGLTNSGMITSTGGTAVFLTGNTGLTASNSGTISGTTAGLSTFGYIFTNTGTISASSGPAVLLNFYSSLINKAGGEVNGDVSAASGSANYGSGVTNAGTINGNVNFGTSFPIATGNTFIALDGGIVNGNLVLGSGGDTFVTSLTNTGTGAFAGVTGTVTGGPNESLIYRVDADTTAKLATAGGIFTQVGYDLANSAKLTLTSSAASSATQSFTGTGTVNLTADINGAGTTGQPLIDLTQRSPRATPPNAIALTSNGKLTVTNTSLYAYTGIAANIGSGSSFTNAGTITVNDTASRPSYLAVPIAILSSGGSAVNSGTLSIGGVIGIEQQPGYYGTSPRATVSNSGTISQLAGAADAIGVAGTFTLTNTGTISTGGSAVLFNGSTSSVINSGTISSTHTATITDGITGFTFYSPANQVVNQAGGTISGGTGQAAIALGGGGIVDNAGTINGDVVFGPATNPFSFYSLPGSTYVARGGTLNGNLTFGAGNDTLIVVGNTTGVTGKVDAGAGTNTYAQLYTSSTTVDPSKQTAPSGFQAYAIGASGSGTTVTISGPAGGLNAPLSLFGDGAINNKANINAQTQPNMASNIVSLGQLNAALSVSNGLTFVNEATIADGVSGTVAGFTNSGSIGSNSLQYGPVYLTAADGNAFSFNNSGKITGPNPTSAQFFLTPTVTIGDPYPSTITRQTASIINSGTIAGEFITSLTANQFNFTNSGTINGLSTPYNGGTIALSLGAYGVGSYLLTPLFGLPCRVALAAQATA